jgi:hypothetical protein
MRGDREEPRPRTLRLDHPHDQEARRAQVTEGHPHNAAKGSERFPALSQYDRGSVGGRTPAHKDGDLFRNDVPLEVGDPLALFDLARPLQAREPARVQAMTGPGFVVLASHDPPRPCSRAARSIGGWVRDALAVAGHLGIGQFMTVGTSTGARTRWRWGLHR